MRADEEDEAFSLSSAAPPSGGGRGGGRGTLCGHTQTPTPPLPRLHRITVPDGDKHTWPPPSVDLVGGLTQIVLLLFVLWLDADRR